MSDLSHRVRQAQLRLTRITAVPLLVRTGILLTALLAQSLAWPAELFLGRAFGPLVLVALLAALAPRRVFPTLTALVAVTGWLLATTWYDERVALWRLLGLATVLYLTHSLCALAALLPYDAAVDPAVVARWVGHALVVTVAAATLAIALLALAGRTGGAEFTGAVLAGLLVAMLAAALLGWLLRRRQP